MGKEEGSEQRGRGRAFEISAALIWTIFSAAAGAIGTAIVQNGRAAGLAEDLGRARSDLKTAQNELKTALSMGDGLRTEIDRMNHQPKDQELVACQAHVAALNNDQNGKVVAQLEAIQKEMAWQEQGMQQEHFMTTVSQLGSSHSDYSDDYLRTKAKWERNAADLSALRQKLVCAQ
jgi:hypothetical protein